MEVADLCEEKREKGFDNGLDEEEPRKVKGSSRESNTRGIQFDQTPMHPVRVMGNQFSCNGLD